MSTKLWSTHSLVFPDGFCAIAWQNCTKCRLSLSYFLILKSDFDSTPLFLILLLFAFVCGACGFALLLDTLADFTQLLRNASEFSKLAYNLCVFHACVKYLSMAKQLEYTEGPVALENFKRLATAILQAPAKSTCTKFGS